MKQLLAWFYWYYIISANCKHTPSSWIMREAGMGKFKCCTQCARVLELI